MPSRGQREIKAALDALNHLHKVAEAMAKAIVALEVKVEAIQKQLPKKPDADAST